MALFLAGAGAGAGAVYGIAELAYWQLSHMPQPEFIMAKTTAYSKSMTTFSHASARIQPGKNHHLLKVIGNFLTCPSQNSNPGSGERQPGVSETVANMQCICLVWPNLEWQDKRMCLPYHHY